MRAGFFSCAAATGAPAGYLGPVGIPKDLTLIVDRTVAMMADFICGANERDFHLRGVNFGRDCREPDGVAELDDRLDYLLGPVLSSLRVGSYPEALALVNGHEFGNGAAIFTRDGDVARGAGAVVPDLE